MHDLIQRAIAAFGSDPALYEREADAALCEFESITPADFSARLNDGAIEDAETAGRYKVQDGVAVLSISGPIVRAGSIYARLGFFHSARSIVASVRAAAADPSARSILIDVASPGGAAAGMDEAAAAVREAKAVKTVAAHVDSVGASAAYWVISGASRITVGRMARVGSIGVMMVVEKQVEPDSQGRREFVITSSHAGAKAPDPETSEGKATLRAAADSMAEVFVDDVAKGRGITSAQIHKINGNAPIGADAVALGLADAVGTRDAVLRSLTGRGPDSAAVVAPIQAKGDTMSKETSTATPSTEATATTPATVPAPAAPVTTAADHAEISTLCNAAGLHELTPGLISAGATIETVRAEIDKAGKMRAIADQAHALNPSLDANALYADARARAIGPDKLRAEVLDKLASAQTPDNAVQPRIVPGTESAITPNTTGAAKGDWKAAFGRFKKEG